MLELCHRRIRLVAAHGGQNTFYEVPGVILGYPLYNLNQCTTYLIDALRADGFLVQLLPPPNVAVLYLSWDPSELRGGPGSRNGPRAPALMDETRRPGGPASAAPAAAPKRVRFEDPKPTLRLF